MKPIEDVVAAVIDYGSFVSVADKLAQTFKTQYYYSPFEEEFRDIRDCVIGDGLKKAIRLNEYMDPEVYDTIDLWVFPDIGFGGFQKFLKREGKAVWGSMGASNLELYRTQFLKVLKEVGLPVVPSVVIRGLTALREHLKTVKDKWVKINRYRRNMETWHHLDYTHSKRMLDSYAVVFGGLQEKPVFVVQDNVPDAREIGYDGMFVNGRYPANTFQGYEKKNELYLGSKLANEDLPEEILEVNRKMAPVLEQFGYCNWLATEIRIKDGEAFYIDPTHRMPGQTGEHQLETCTNLPDVIWQGANGGFVEPDFSEPFATEATLHYDGHTGDTAIAREWKTLRIPREAERWLKFYHYCIADGLHHFPPHQTDEVGVVLGVGSTIEQALDHLKENFAMLKGLPLHIELAGFQSLLAEIKEAQASGIKFTDQRVPEPETMLETA